MSCPAPCGGCDRWRAARGCPPRWRRLSQLGLEALGVDLVDGHEPPDEPPGRQDSDREDGEAARPMAAGRPVPGRSRARRAPPRRRPPRVPCRPRASPARSLPLASPCASPCESARGPRSRTAHRLVHRVLAELRHFEQVRHRLHVLRGTERPGEDPAEVLDRGLPGLAAEARMREGPLHRSVGRDDGSSRVRLPPQRVKADLDRLLRPASPLDRPPRPDPRRRSAATGSRARWPRPPGPPRWRARS